jgi:hypothetical protein
MVIAHSFKRAKEAFHEHESIEIRGFGKFVVSSSRVEKEKRKDAMKMTKFQREHDDPQATTMIKENRLLWMRRMEEDLELIKKLTHEI